MPLLFFVGFSGNEYSFRKNMTEALDKISLLSLNLMKNLQDRGVNVLLDQSANIQHMNKEPCVQECGSNQVQVHLTDDQVTTFRLMYYKMYSSSCKRLYSSPSRTLTNIDMLAIAGQELCPTCREDGFTCGFAFAYVRRTGDEDDGHSHVGRLQIDPPVYCTQCDNWTHLSCRLVNLVKSGTMEMCPLCRNVDHMFHLISAQVALHVLGGVYQVAEYSKEAIKYYKNKLHRREAEKDDAILQATHAVALEKETARNKLLENTRKWKKLLETVLSESRTKLTDVSMHTKEQLSSMERTLHTEYASKMKFALQRAVETKELEITSMYEVKLKEIREETIAIQASVLSHDIEQKRRCYEEHVVLHRSHIGALVELAELRYVGMFNARRNAMFGLIKSNAPHKAKVVSIFAEIEKSVYVILAPYKVRENLQAFATKETHRLVHELATLPENIVTYVDDGTEIIEESKRSIIENTDLLTNAVLQVSLNTDLIDMRKIKNDVFSKEFILLHIKQTFERYALFAELVFRTVQHLRYRVLFSKFGGEQGDAAIATVSEESLKEIMDAKCFTFRHQQEQSLVAFMQDIEK